MVLSIFKPPATFKAGVGELPKVDKKSCDDLTQLLLDFGFVWVGEWVFESGGEVGWIAELLEWSEDWCAVMDWVLPQLRSAAVVVTGQSPKKQANASVAAFQSSSRPDVRSPQAFVISETITPGNLSRSSTIAPVSMSLKTLTAPVIAASATSTIWVGKLTKMRMRSEIAPVTSSGRFSMILGTLPCSSSSTKALASAASFSNVWMMSHGMSLRRRTIFWDRKRPLTIRLLIASVSKRLTHGGSLTHIGIIDAARVGFASILPRRWPDEMSRLLQQSEVNRQDILPGVKRWPLRSSWVVTRRKLWAKMKVQYNAATECESLRKSKPAD